MAFNARLRRCAPAIETLRIYAIDTEQADLPAVDAMAERVNQSPVLIVVETSFPRWKNKHLGARMPKGKELHFAAEGVAEPLMILTLHLIPA